MNKNKLGNLEKISLREAWEDEARDFTPWLARDENIGLLGDTIGMELEVEAREKSIGPFTLDSDDSIPEPVGGGGTSFVPFFEKVGKKPGSTDVIVYLTDGYGVFPRKAPQENVLWVVPGAGLHDEKFPFGEVIRMEAA